MKKKPLHCSFSSLFVYELWIENWNCDFPSAVYCPFIIFFPRFSRFFFGFYNFHKNIALFFCIKLGSFGQIIVLWRTSMNETWTVFKVCVDFSTINCVNYTHYMKIHVKEFYFKNTFVRKFKIKGKILWINLQWS